jgi:hypothetical protein
VPTGERRRLPLTPAKLPATAPVACGGR